MKYELYEDMALTRDLPAEWLKRGDIVKLVEHPTRLCSFPTGDSGRRTQDFLPSVS